MLMHGTKYQQWSSIVLGFGVLKLLITLNQSDRLRVHLMPNSISLVQHGQIQSAWFSMVHHTLANVCDQLLSCFFDGTLKSE
jgi:hypothetical protein